MKVIFLDVDGVLNHVDDEDNVPDRLYLLDDEKLIILQEMVERTEAVLVLSSSWRRGWVLPPAFDNASKRADVEKSTSYFMLCAKLHEYGLGLLSEIPRLDYGNRETEIHYWLQEWGGEAIKGYAILDDEKQLFSKGNPHLVLTSPKEGLKKEHIDQVIQILG